MSQAETLEEGLQPFEEAKTASEEPTCGQIQRSTRYKASPGPMIEAEGEHWALREARSSEAG